MKHPAPTLKELSASKPELKALYARIGGEEQLEKILTDFYLRMSQDVMIGFFFNGKNLKKIISKQKEFLMRAMGAIPSYSGKPPADAHKALAPILSGHFDRRLQILHETLRSHGIKESDIKVWISFENTFRDAILR